MLDSEGEQREIKYAIEDQETLIAAAIAVQIESTEDFQRLLKIFNGNVDRTIRVLYNNLHLEELARRADYSEDDY